MSDTTERLLARIRLGEDQRLELKEVAFAGSRIKGPDRAALADEIAAMANAHGGTLVLGVSDKTREVTGIPISSLDRVESWVREIVVDLLEPPLNAAIEKVEFVLQGGERRQVIRVDVPRSLYIHRSPSGYHYRVGSARRKMATDFLARMLQQRSQSRLIRFDEMLIPEAKVDDLAPELVNRFRSASTRDELPAFLSKLAMAAEDEDGILRPTVAGVLLGSRSPQEWLSHAYVQAVAYRGTEVEGGVGYQLDARDCHGPLDQQVIDACRFVERNMRIEASKILGRTDLPQYDITSIFEALVNAVAHRDYSMHGSRIRLKMFWDRLELYVPGPLANTMNVENMPFRQSSRNEAIASLLAKLPVPRDIEGLETTRTNFMDRRGDGVLAILERTEQHSGKRPVYRMLDESELMLTIHAASALEMHANLKPRLGSS